MSPQWILVLVLIAVVYFFFIKSKPLPSADHKNKKKNKLEGDDMIECKKCGTYITLKEAMLRDGEYFCSSECLKA